MSSKFLKASNNNKRGHIDATIKPEVELKYPVFCFKHLHKEYDLTICSTEDVHFFTENLIKLSQLTWEQIKLTDRKGMGSEKISIKSLKSTIPNSLTPDIEELLVFRFHKRRMLGYRNKFIFHIIFIDTKLTLYNH